MSLSMYQITGELREQLALLADIDMTPEAAHDTMEAIQYPFEEKVRAVVAFARELDAEAEVVEGEAKRLMERAKATQARARSLRDYTMRAIQAVGYATPLRFAEFTVSVQRNPQAVLVEADPATLPADLVRVETTYSPDKKAIAERLKAGEEIAGCRLSDPTFRLAVK